MNWDITPGLLLRAYASGIFPMAESADDPEVHWVDPSRRGVLPLDGLHLSRSLKRAIRAEHYQVSFDAEFAGVVQGCAERQETWINATIAELYAALFKRSYAHSQEIWADGVLIGGVYGVAIGAAFFGESMFSRQRDASKIALAYLVDRLKLTGFQLFDTQFGTPHLQTLGGCEISRQEYLGRLENAVEQSADITVLPVPQSAAAILQRNAQTS